MTKTVSTARRDVAREPEPRPDAPWAAVPFTVLGGPKHKGSRGVLQAFCRLSALARPTESGRRQVRFKRWTDAAKLLEVHPDTLRRYLARLVEAGAILVSGRTIGFLTPHFCKLPLALLDAPWSAIVAWSALWQSVRWQGPEALLLRRDGISELYRLAGGDRRHGDRRHGHAGLTWLREHGWVSLELGFPIVVRLVPSGPPSDSAVKVPHPEHSGNSSSGASTPSLFSDLNSQQLLEPRKEDAEEPTRRTKGRQGDPDVIAVWKAYVQAGTEAGLKVSSRITKTEANVIWGALIRYGRPQCIEAVRGVWRLGFVIENYGGRAEVRWAFKRGDPKRGRKVLDWSLERVRECVRILNPERRFPKLPVEARHGIDGAQVAIGAHIYEPSDDDSEPLVVVETKAPAPATTIPAGVFGRAVRLLNRTAEIREAQDFGRKLFSRTETLELLRVATRLS